MEKKVHIWKVRCKSCGEEFEHVFVASDILKPHVFNDMPMECPKCKKTTWDLVQALKKEPLEQWQQEHPDLNIKDLPDHSYLENE